MSYQDPPVNPYDPSSQDFTPETLPMDQVIKMAIESAFVKKHVWMPAQVVNIRGNQKVDIQVLLQSRYADGTLVLPKPVQNVMVSMPMGSDYSIKLPVLVGDTGIALFCDRSLDNWCVSGGIVDPADSRTHDFSDPIFIPGLYPFSGQTTDLTTDLVVTNGLVKAKFKKIGGVEFSGAVMDVKFNPDGTFTFTNSAVELMDLLVQITDQVQTLSETLSTDTVNTMLGPQKLNAFLEYEDIALALEELLVKLTTLKGVL